MTAPASPPPVSGPLLGPFRYPAFRAIWIANLTSSVGSMIQSVGAAWLMTELTRSHVLIALVQASATIPILLFGVFAGAIADNFDRRRVMLAAQAGMLVISAILALLAGAGAITPALLLVMTLGVGTGTAINAPAWQASVRKTVGPRDLAQAISLNTIAFNLARSVGPALGGLLISLTSIAVAFAVNAVSYLAMIAVLLRWRPAPGEPRERRPMLAAIGEGMGYCARSGPIRRILARGLVIGFGVAGYQALLPAVARDRLHGTEIDYGLMLGAFGVGSILVALLVGRARRRWGSEAVVGAATAAFILAELTIARATALPLALAATFLAGAGWVAAMTSLNIAMQLRSPEAMLGRCLSLYQAVTFGGMALGAYAWGALADAVSLTFAINAAAVWLGVTLIAMRLLAPMPGRAEGRIEAEQPSRSPPNPGAT